MSAIAVAALILATLWLVVLTVVVMLLVRQVGLVTIRLDRAREQNTPVAGDGVAVGTPLSEPVAAVLTPGAEPAYMLILEAGCGPAASSRALSTSCRWRAARWRSSAARRIAPPNSQAGCPTGSPRAWIRTPPRSRTPSTS